MFLVVAGFFGFRLVEIVFLIFGIMNLFWLFSRCNIIRSIFVYVLGYIFIGYMFRSGIGNGRLLRVE